jgi:hypothetical protein
MNSLLVGLAFAVGAPTLKEKENPPSLVGEWVIEEHTVGGKVGGPGPPNRWVFRADGTRAIVGADGKEIVGGHYTTDAKGGTLDLVSTGPASDPYLCRYKLDGDKLILSVGWQKAGRPPGLESPPDSQCTLYEMKRAKPKE